MDILVINAGSSSLKYQLINIETETVLAKGLCERIGMDGSNIKQTAGAVVYEASMPLPDHTVAFGAVTAALTDPEKGAVPDMRSISAVGHRVVHGGEHFTESVLIDDAVLTAIEENIPLAPLHNPANLTGIKACAAVMPGVPMVAVFDTAFHQTMPRRAYLYGLPYDYYQRLRVRRYGFHGTSHRYVSRKAAEILDRPIETLKLVICHLGNGSSISAVDGGKSIDTTMGLTPLEGMLMGTRSGDLDPAIVEFLCKAENLSVSQVTDILNKKSGLLGVSEISSDWRDIDEAATAGNDAAKRTAEVFAYRARKVIGAYAMAMNGLDAVVFTAGIGENNAHAREWILTDTDFLGIVLDKEKNKIKGQTVISAENSRVMALMIPTNEELAIARDTAEIVG